MIAAADLVLAPIENLQDINGVPFPEQPRFRQFLITGPPGAGKSTQVGRMRGWPYEGYVDLSVPKWWRVQTLTFRPREVHLGAPFEGRVDALSVLDDEWVENCQSLEIDFRRIAIPPERAWLLGTAWRSRYVFEFILPPAESVYAYRVERAKTGLFPRDRHITAKIVDRQVAFYRSLAWYFWRSEMHVYVRVDHGGPPMRIVECKNPPAI